MPIVALHCNTLKNTATHRNALQHTATHCNALQHTATHCNTLQHTARHSGGAWNAMRHCVAVGTCVAVGFWLLERDAALCCSWVLEGDALCQKPEAKCNTRHGTPCALPRPYLHKIVTDCNRMQDTNTLDGSQCSMRRLRRRCARQRRTERGYTPE